MIELVPISSPVDLSRFWLVAILAITVYVGALGTVVRWVVRWRAARRAADVPAVESGGGRGRRRVFRILESINLGLAGLGIVAAVYAFYEPYRPEVVWVRIPTGKLPEGSSPIRIVQLSDIHSDDVARLEDDLPKTVAGMRPDAIVFTGDAVNRDDGLPHFRRLMQALAAVAPTFAVRGNWDVWWFSHLRFFDGTGVRDLNGEAVPLSVRSVRLWFVGAPVEGHDLLWPVLGEVPPDDLSIVLHHYPEVGAKALERGADLALAGDTHGGQVRVPLLGPLIRISRFGAYHDAGLHRIGHGLLYVNRGVGMEGGWVPRVRFGCRPEITVVEIVPEAG